MDSTYSRQFLPDWDACFPARLVVDQQFYNQLENNSNLVHVVVQLVYLWHIHYTG